MDAMGWVVLVVIGGVAGWFASILMKSRQGWVMNMVLGIVGASVGGLLFNLLGTRSAAPFNIWSLNLAVTAGTTSFNVWSLLLAVSGAAALLGGVRLFVGKTRAAY